MNKALLILFVLLPLFIRAQVTGSNQAVFQIGNLPEQQPSDRSNLYNQLNLQANWQNIQLVLRAESYAVDDRRKYNKISQKLLRYSYNGFTVQIGNFYEMFGRGSLLRMYEIPGTVYEDTGTRQRYGFYRDIEGLNLRYEKNGWDISAVYGRPLDLIIPPAYGREQRRSRLVQGAQARYTVSPLWRPGLVYLRSDANKQSTSYWGALSEGRAEMFDYYLEYNQQQGFDPLREGTPYALYGAFNFYLDAVALSLEYKDYNKFTLGFNEPPPTVKEHSFTLLNRSTHSPEPNSETGFQLEALFNVGGFNTVTLNASRAVNQIAGFEAVFYEYYADLQYFFYETWQGKAFVDYSQDELLGETERYTAGFQVEGSITALWGLALEIQLQQLKRRFTPVDVVANQLFSLSLSRAPDFSVAFLMERSNDPIEIYNNDTIIYWPALIVNYQMDSHTSFNLFYGRRRGGNACTGGICYRVLPFNGLELQITTRI